MAISVIMKRVPPPITEGVAPWKAQVQSSIISLQLKLMLYIVKELRIQLKGHIERYIWET